MRAAIVLAAGLSRRFGRADKLLVRLHGAPLLLHAIRAARKAPAGRVVVVSARASRVRSLVRAAGLRHVAVVRAAPGGAPLSASLAAGIRALRPIERDAFLFLGDMPFVDPGTAARLTRTPPVHSIVRPRFRGTPGHPVLIRGIRRLPVGGGDGGFAARVPGRWIESGRDCIADVDRRGDLARARRRRLRG